MKNGSRRAVAPAHDQIQVSYQDSTTFRSDDLSFHREGMCLKTRWFMPIGTEVEVAMTLPSKKLAISGVVVACLPDATSDRTFDVTLFFPALSGPQRKGILSASEALVESF